MRRSLSVHAYTMHTVPIFLQIDEHLFPSEIEQIAELADTSIEIVQDIYEGLRSAADKVGDKVACLLRLRLEANKLFYESLRSNCMPVPTCTTYEEILSALKEGDYRIISRSLYFTFWERYLPKEIHTELSKKMCNEKNQRMLCTAHLRAESNLHVKKQFNSYLKRYKQPKS